MKLDCKKIKLSTSENTKEDQTEEQKISLFQSHLIDLLIKGIQDCSQNEKMTERISLISQNLKLENPLDIIVQKIESLEVKFD